MEDAEQGQNKPATGNVVQVKLAQAPERPEQLTGHAKEHWDYLARCLTENGTIKPGFAAVMLAASLAYSDMMDALEAIAQLKELKENTKGTQSILEINNLLISYIKTLRGARKDLVTFSAKLNLTPNDWARSGLERMLPSKPKTKLEALIG